MGVLIAPPSPGTHVCKTSNMQQEMHVLPSASSSAGQRSHTQPCSLHHWKDSSEANLPQGDSSSSPHLKAIALITLLIPQYSIKEEISSSLWKNNFSFFFFAFNVDAN